MLDRLAEAERMTLDQYREDLAHREKVRARYAELEADCDACVSLSAPAAAPLGLDSTGDPNCTVHASLLGIPAISLPVLQALGLQIAGFINGDAQACSKCERAQSHLQISAGSHWTASSASQSRFYLPRQFARAFGNISRT